MEKHVFLLKCGQIPGKTGVFATCIKGCRPNVVKTMEKHMFFDTSIKGYHPDVVKSMEKHVFLLKCGQIPGKTGVFATCIMGCRPNVVKSQEKQVFFLHFYQRVPPRCHENSEIKPRSAATASKPL